MTVADQDVLDGLLAGCAARTASGSSSGTWRGPRGRGRRRRTSTSSSCRTTGDVRRLLRRLRRRCPTYASSSYRAPGTSTPSRTCRPASLAVQRARRARRRDRGARAGARPRGAAGDRRRRPGHGRRPVGTRRPRVARRPAGDGARPRRRSGAPSGGVSRRSRPTSSGWRGRRGRRRRGTCTGSAELPALLPDVEISDLVLPLDPDDGAPGRRRGPRRAARTARSS